jgi:hypothetical protein
LRERILKINKYIISLLTIIIGPSLALIPSSLGRSPVFI